MPRIDREEQNFDFRNGLITESSPFNFPENSALDLNNVIIELSGKVRRREGIDKEPNAQDEANSDIGTTENNTFLWENVNNDPNSNFVVVQVASELHFYDADKDSLSNNKVGSVELDNQSPIVQNASKADINKIFFDSGNGALFGVNKYMAPFRITYDSNAGTFSAKEIVVETRDFEGVDDDEGLTGRPDTIDDAHRYNLQNQGWPDSTEFYVFKDEAGSNKLLKNPADYYNSKFGEFPANRDIFTLGLRADADLTEAKFAFSPWQMRRLVQDVQTDPPKGHYILNFFDKKRTDVPNVSDNSLDESLDTRPEAVAFFSERLWLAFEETIFFSQIADQFQDKDPGNVPGLSPKFYQKQDPTAANFNSLLPTDGGTITLTGAGKITNLVSLGNSVIIFSKNGVWQILGTDDSGFTAKSFTVQKISNEGVITPTSIVQERSNIYFWSENGIYRLSPQEGSPLLQSENLTVSTIQSRYDDLDVADKRSADGEWIRNEGKIYWNFVSSVSGVPYTIIVYDLFIKAFYLLEVGQTKNNESNAQVKNTIPSNKFKFLTAHEDSNGDKQFVFSEFNNRNFKDWETVQSDLDYDPQDYNSFIETRYILSGGDVIRNKRATYVFCYFNITETGYKEDNNGNLVFKDPSGCKLLARWDFTRDDKAGKEQDLGDVYRLNRYYLPSGKNDPFDFSYSVAVSKNKVRGNGRALTLRFESQDGKDFQLYGYAMPMTIRGAP